MKKIVKWLANVTGVEKQIRDDERYRIGGELDSTSYWFTDYKKYPFIYPFLMFLSDKLKTNHFIRGDFSREWWDNAVKNDPQISMHLQKIKELTAKYHIK